MKALQFVVIMVLGGSCGFSASRPNILWLVGENLEHELGCYGEKLVLKSKMARVIFSSPPPVFGKRRLPP